MSLKVEEKRLKWSRMLLDFFLSFFSRLTFSMSFSLRLFVCLFPSFSVQASLLQILSLPHTIELWQWLLPLIGVNFYLNVWKKQICLVSSIDGMNISLFTPAINFKTAQGTFTSFKSLPFLGFSAEIITRLPEGLIFVQKNQARTAGLLRHCDGRIWDNGMKRTANTIQGQSVNKTFTFIRSSLTSS